MQWSPIFQSAVVDLVAPASKCAEHEIMSSQQVLADWGYSSRLPVDLFAEHPFFSNVDSIREKQFLQALRAKDSHAVWCVRGGYGSQRLLPSLGKLKSPKVVKPFLGLSDITSLHSFLNETWKWPTLHAPIFSKLGKRDLPESSIKELFAVLSGEQKTVEFSNLTPLNSKAQAKNKKVIKGQVLGGNLTTYMALFGTPWQPKMKNSILFFEDVSERGYRLDRLLFQLQHSAYFKNVQAVVFGDFTEGLEADGRDLQWVALNTWAMNQKIPVFKGLDSGHGKIQRVVPLGTPAELILGPLPQLVVTSGVKLR